ncbi:MAG: serine/threonine protein phosphatase [Bacteroidia bacterium]|nr:serine/threonine protein phosphatase [Bacteroidia bacterium]
MNSFIIGDVHGCFFTLRQILKHWDLETETLVLVGDLIDRGNHSPEVVNLCMQLDEAYENAVFLKGNHELLCLSYYQSGYNEVWIKNGGRETLDQFEARNFDLKKGLHWLRNLPAKYETDHLLVTHAGLSTHLDPYDEENWNGVFWNRNPPLDLGKLQVHGHTPQHSGLPRHIPEINAINIDTAAVFNQCLTGLKVDPEGNILKIIQETTHPHDSFYFSP